MRPITSTVAIIKPGFIHLYDELVDWIQKENFKVVNTINPIQLEKELVEKLYEEHRGKSFFDDHIEYMCSGPCILLLIEKENCTQQFRELLGAVTSNRKETIRKKYGKDVRRNVMHASDSQTSFEREIFLLKKYF